MRVNIIINLGAKPRRGGRPPRERRRIEIDRDDFGFMTWKEGNCLILYRLRIWRRIIRDPDVME